MTLTVDFLPFATGGSANVESQADYAADPSTTNGFSAGLASSAKFNKAMRQASVLAAAMANWVSQKLNASVLDDGNLTNLVDQIDGAVAATIQSSACLFATASGVNSLAAPLSPPPAALATGMRVLIKIASDNTGAVTLNLNGLGAKAVTYAGAALSAGMLKAGQIYALAYDGSSFQLTTTTVHGVVASSLGSNGYRIFSDGSIDLWGSGAHADNSGVQHVSFPFTLPTGILNPVASNAGSGPPVAFHGTGNYTTTGMDVYSSIGPGSVAAGSGTAFNWRVTAH